MLHVAKHVAGLTIRVPNAGDASDRGKGRAGDLLVRANVAVSKVIGGNLLLRSLSSSSDI